MNVKAMAQASLELQIKDARAAGDMQKVAELQRRLALIVGVARREQQAAIQEDTRLMQYRFGGH